MDQEITLHDGTITTLAKEAETFNIAPDEYKKQFAEREADCYADKVELIREEQAEELRTARENKAKLPGVKIPEEIHVTSDLSEALIDKDVIVMAVPSVAVRTTAKKMSSHIRYGQVIVYVA